MRKKRKIEKERVKDGGGDMKNKERNRTERKIRRKESNQSER